MRKSPVEAERELARAYNWPSGPEVRSALCTPIRLTTALGRSKSGAGADGSCERGTTLQALEYEQWEHAG